MSKVMEHEINDEYWDIVKKLYIRFMKKNGDGNFYNLMNSDGIPIGIWKILFGYMSSSTILKILVDRWGFDEVESDLRWLKRKEVK